MSTGGTLPGGPYVGFRRWEVKDWPFHTSLRGKRELRLFPLNQLTGEPWATDVMLAQCGQSIDGAGPPHRSPDDVCRCGLYHCARPEQIEHGGGIAGAAQLFGRVRRATRGYRVEKARIIALVDPARDAGSTLEDDTVRARKVAAVYGVPLLPNLEALLAFAEEHAKLPSEEDIAHPTRLTAEIEVELEPLVSMTESGLEVVHGEETWLAKLEGVREFVPDPWRATDGLVEAEDEDDPAAGVAQRRWLRLALTAEVRGLRQRGVALAELEEFAARFKGEVQNYRGAGG